MWRQEGILSFFKGNGINCVRIAPFSAFEFFFYEFYKNNLYPGKEKWQFTFKEKLYCGALTGMTASTLTYPLDLIRTYLVINTSDVKIGMIEQGKIIFAKDGFLGLYKGWGTSMCGIAPYVAIKMASFDFLM